MPNNLDRQRWAAAALANHSAATGVQTEDAETQLSDLLTNIRHLCRIKSIDFSACNHRSKQMHKEEASFNDLEDN